MPFNYRLFVHDECCRSSYMLHDNASSATQSSADNAEVVCRLTGENTWNDSFWSCHWTERVHAPVPASARHVHMPGSCHEWRVARRDTSVSFWSLGYTLLIDIGTQTGLPANATPTDKLVSVVRISAEGLFWPWFSLSLATSDKRRSAQVISLEAWLHAGEPFHRREETRGCQTGGEVGFVYCLTLLGMVVDLIREVLDDTWLVKARLRC